MRWTTAQLKAYQGQISEHDLQAHCVAWFREKYPDFALLLFAIPNGADLQGENRMESARRWNKIKKEGAVKGAADLFLAVPSQELAGLFIEMKTPKGRQSAEQQEFEQRVIWAGYGYALPRTFEEFKFMIALYFKQ